MRTLAWVGFAGAAAAAAGVVIIACDTVGPVPPPPAQGFCASNPGEYPKAGCNDYAPDAAACQSPPPSCNTAPCNSGSPCLAMNADNSGQPLASLRMRKLNVTAPTALASSFVQQNVIDNGINLQNHCGEFGDGTFSWLMQFDTVGLTLKTGGAPPTSDPFGTGYCFVDTSINGIQVGPITTPLTTAADGTWQSGVIPKLNVPIYIGASVMGAGAPSVVVLPLTNGKVEQITLSPDKNCIGQYNPGAVTPNDAGYCTDNATVCSRWTTAGSLGGYITLDDADSVDVPQLSESLCVMLAAPETIDTSNSSEKRCVKTNGHVDPTDAKGNFCSTTQTPGGCADSFWLAATFAASAVKIVEPNQPACMGVAVGGDGGGGGDSGPGDGGDGAADAASDGPSGDSGDGGVTNDGASGG